VILVVAAWKPELRALGRALRDRRGRPIERAVVGVGLVEAALGASRALARRRPRAVVLVGTAGVYPRSGRAPAVGDVVVARRIHLVSVSVARGLAYFPGPMPVTAACDRTLRSDLARSAAARQVDVACPSAITRGAAAATALATAAGAAVENLEAFAVARAAAEVGVPFVAVLGIANQVGPRAHAQWAAHGAEAAARACSGLRAFLEDR
jgi:nucleoside phosphorylase